jgi:hypothetical protein
MGNYVKAAACALVVALAALFLIGRALDRGFEDSPASFMAGEPK